MSERVDVSEAPDLIVETIAMWCSDEALAQLARTCRRIHAICAAEQSRRPPPTYKARLLPGVAEWLTSIPLDSHRIEMKVAFLGADMSGKTALVERVVRGRYNAVQQTTIGAAFYRFPTTAYDHNVVLQLWDTAGQERYNALARMYYRRACLAVITVSATNPNSFQTAKMWYEQVSVEEEKMRFVMVVCRTDLGWASEGFRKDCRLFCRERRIAIVECSAKDGVGIEQFIEAMSVEALNGKYCIDGFAEEPAALPRRTEPIRRSPRPTKPCIIS